VNKTKNRYLSDNFLEEEILDWGEYLLDDIDDKKSQFLLGMSTLVDH